MKWRAGRVADPRPRTSGAAIAVCSSPEEDCAAFALRAIDHAESEILLTPHHTSGARSEPAHVSFFGPNGSNAEGPAFEFLHGTPQHPF